MKTKIITPIICLSLISLLPAKSRSDMTPSELLLGHWIYESPLKDGGMEEVHEFFMKENFLQYRVKASYRTHEASYEIISENVNKKKIHVKIKYLEMDDYTIYYHYKMTFSNEGDRADISEWPIIIGSNGSVGDEKEATVKTYLFIDDKTIEKSQTFGSISGRDEIIDNREKLNGLLNIDWGTPSLRAKQLLLERNEVSFGKEEDGILQFDGGTLAGYKVGSWLLYFNNDKLYEARVGIDIELDAKAISKYNEIKALLTKKYGSPDVDVANYKYPYEEGDGHAETAIKLGKATIGANWKLDKSAVEIIIISTLDILIKYSSNNLSKEANEKIEQKKMDEF